MGVFGISPEFSEFSEENGPVPQESFYMRSMTCVNILNPQKEQKKEKKEQKHKYYEVHKEQIFKIYTENNKEKITKYQFECRYDPSHKSKKKSIRIRTN